MSETVQFCKHNPGVVCDPEKADCEKCGWNPDVWRKRKANLFYQTYGRSENTETTKKVVYGTALTMRGAKPGPIAVSVTKSDKGDILTMEYSAAGIALAIPLESVREMMGGTDHE